MSPRTSLAVAQASMPRLRCCFLLALLVTSALADAAPRRRLVERRVPYPAAIEHVVVIVLENESAGPAERQPYLGELSMRGARLVNSFGITHPSRPNYIAMIAGSTLGLTDNSTVTLNAQHLGDLLEARGKTWRVYAENYPGNCFLGDSAPGGYVRRHIGFLDFLNVQKNPARCANVVNATQFDADVASNSLPSFALYVPNNNDNGHDTGIATADRWLNGRLEPLLRDPRLATTLFVVTFDESNPSDPSNRIYTVLIGAGVRGGATTAVAYTHYSLLRTIEEIFGLDSLHRADATSAPIRDVWTQ